MWVYQSGLGSKTVQDGNNVNEGAKRLETVLAMQARDAITPQGEKTYLTLLNQMENSKALSSTDKMGVFGQLFHSLWRIYGHKPGKALTETWRAYGDQLDYIAKHEPAGIGLAKQRVMYQLYYLVFVENNKTLTRETCILDDQPEARWILDDAVKRLSQIPEMKPVVGILRQVMQERKFDMNLFNTIVENGLMGHLHRLGGLAEGPTHRLELTEQEKLEANLTLIPQDLKKMGKNNRLWNSQIEKEMEETEKYLNSPQGKEELCDIIQFNAWGVYDAWEVMRPFHLSVGMRDIIKERMSGVRLHDRDIDGNFHIVGGFAVPAKDRGKQMVADRYGETAATVLHPLIASIYFLLPEFSAKGPTASLHRQYFGHFLHELLHIASGYFGPKNMEKTGFFSGISGLAGEIANYNMADPSKQTMIDPNIALEEGMTDLASRDKAYDFLSAAISQKMQEIPSADRMENADKLMRAWLNFSDKKENAEAEAFVKNALDRARE